MEDDLTWVESNLSGAAGALGAEAIELINCLLCFGCASEELRVVVPILEEWMANSSPCWDVYGALTECCLVTLYKTPWLTPVGIGETLCQALNRLVMRTSGDQAKTACGSLLLCAGL